MRTSEAYPVWRDSTTVIVAREDSGLVFKGRKHRSGDEADKEEEGAFCQRS